jgi:hypothetical protein
LERELAAEEGLSLPPVASASEAFPVRSLPITPLSNPSPDADTILAQYRQPAASISSRTKLGCVVYFIVALGLLSLAFIAIFLFWKSHPVH